jgi:hypothetical protein
MSFCLAYCEDLEGNQVLERELAVRFQADTNAEKISPAASTCAERLVSQYPESIPITATTMTPAHCGTLQQRLSTTEESRLGAADRVTPFPTICCVRENGSDLFLDRPLPGEKSPPRGRRKVLLALC